MQNHCDQMENIIAECNYTDVISWLNKKGVELFGQLFQLLEEENYVIYKLIAYFLKDTEAFLRYGVDINKGILLAGPIGCGKTALMTIM